MSHRNLNENLVMKHNMSFISVFGHHARRCPAIANGPADVRNNVIYNFLAAERLPTHHTHRALQDQRANQFGGPALCRPRSVVTERSRSCEMAMGWIHPRWSSFAAWRLAALPFTRDVAAKILSIPR
jgi:hypothetical protein